MTSRSGLKGGFKLFKNIIVICGPTASGKTAAAIEIAQKIGAEIISADSGQIYRGMDIGTAKPTQKEQETARFHLIDILNPDQQFSAADFRERAMKAIEEIHQRGKRVIIVGGTGLYIKALQEGLFEGPSKDEKIRLELETQIQKEGVESLYQELEKVDPEAAKVIPAKNRHRLIRALEVHRLTGRPISFFWKEHQKVKKKSGLSFLKFGLDLSKEELHRRIEVRVEEMIHKGLLGEVKRLVEQWGIAVPGLQIIGYKEMSAHLSGKITFDEAVSLMKVNTKRYAKRQRTWFQKDNEIRWVGDDETLQQDLTKW